LHTVFTQAYFVQECFVFCLHTVFTQAYFVQECFVLCFSGYVEFINLQTFTF
jgi:hypothetical protein